MTCRSQPPRPKLCGSRLTGYVLVVLTGVIGSLSLGVFFGLFVLLGPLNLVDLAQGERAKLAWDVLLCLAFFVQHSGMVRQSYRHRAARLISSTYHGATYTIASGVVLLVLVVFWQESASTLVAAEGILRWLMRAVYLLSMAGGAWGILTLGSFDTFGLRPVLDRLRCTESSPLPFTVRGPYRWVRHPLYTCCLLMIWSYPDVTLDRLLFNILWTAWIIVGTVLEERDLAAAFGATYRDYQRQVPMLIPRRLRPLVEESADHNDQGDH